MFLHKGYYNTQIFNFAEKLSNIFDVSCLDSIANNIGVLKRENDQSTPHHKLFYEWSRTDDFKQIYHNFIVTHIKPLYADKIVIQKIPTFRICYPNNVAVGEFHKDKWYRNGEWASKVRELNFFLPFTDAFDTNTIWVESAEDKNDFAPMNCKYGEFIQWDGPNLLHGNKINETTKTRVSIDFRVIEYANYIPSEHGSINMKSKFKIGEYYDLYD